MLPSIIDIEASGFGRKSYPIEVGFILGNGNTFCSLITPDEEWQRWDDEAERTHGIDRQKLFDFGKPVKQIAIKLNELLFDETIYSDAWANDACWLGLLFEVAQIPQEFRIESIRYLLTENQAAHWHQTKDEIIKSTPLARHRASSDAAILQKTFELVQASYPVSN